MSTFIYDKGRSSFLDGAIAFSSDTIKALLATSGYTASQSADQFVSDIGGGNIVVRSAALSSKTSTAGVANAGNVTISSVSGSAANAIVLYKDTGVDSSSRLIAYIDNYSGLPVTPNGGNITIAWPTDSNKIFKL
jgi:hypothetical protein